MGIRQRGGAVKAHVIADGKKASILPNVLENVTRGTMVNTDRNPAYFSLAQLGYRHESVNHEAEEWARGIHHTNSVEGFWSHLKRGISSTHVAVSRKHMQKYV